jgi:tetratricopeptide (TPR) repeat protein
MLTALRAYGLFVKGDFAEALALDNAAQLDRQQQGLERLGLIERVRSNCLYLTGDNEGADRSCLDMIAAAEESGNASQIAHAYYMSAIGVSSSDRDELAREYYEASFAAARRSGSPTDLAAAWTAKGFATVGDDETALDAFASADRLARSTGNRWMSAFARTEASCLRTIDGDLQRGCEGLADTVDIWYRAGEWAQQWLTLSRSVIALEQIGRSEVAAQVVGAIECHTTIDASPVMSTVRDRALEARQALVVQLGAERFEERRAEGIELPVASLVHRTRSALLGLPDGD